MSGVMMSATSDDTILLNAPPMITPTAISMIFPRIIKALKSLKKVLLPIFLSSFRIIPARELVFTGRIRIFICR